MKEIDEKVVRLIRALANGIGVLLFIILLVGAIQQGGIQRLIELEIRETISFVCILTMFFAMLWASQKPLAGGILILVSYTIMAINMGSAVPGAILPVFFFVGIMHLFIGIKSRT